MENKEVNAEEINIRTAEEEDLPQLVGLLSQLTSTSFDEAMPIFRRIRLYPDYRIYIALARNELAGTLGLMIMDNIGHGGAPIAVVENVVVDQGLRRQGIGRKMFAFAAEKAREKKCYKMILPSHFRLVESHPFYESLGFMKRGYVFSLDL